MILEPESLAGKRRRVAKIFKGKKPYKISDLFMVKITDPTVDKATAKKWEKILNKELKKLL